MPTFTGITHYWTSNNGVWEDTESWSTKSIPDDGDAVVLGGNGSMESITVGPVYPVDLHMFKTLSNCTGQIGGSGSPIGFASDTITHTGKGQFWHLATGTTDAVVVNTTVHNNAFIADTEAGVEYTGIIVARGNVTISAHCNQITHLVVGYYQNQNFDAVVNVPYGAQSITYCDVAGGHLTCGRNISFGRQTGGTWTQTRGYSYNHTQAGGTLVYNTDQTMDILHLHGGTVDLTQSHDTKMINLAFVYPRGNLLYDDTLHDITFADMFGVGAGVALPGGSGVDAGRAI